MSDHSTPIPEPGGNVSRAMAELPVARERLAYNQLLQHTTLLRYDLDKCYEFLNQNCLMQEFMAWAYKLPPLPEVPGLFMDEHGNPL